MTALTDWLIAHTPSARQVFTANLIQLVFWVVMVVPTVTIWAESLRYLVLISVWALVASYLAAVTASLADLAAQQRAETP